MEEKMSRAEKKMAQNSITTKDMEETGMTGMDSQETNCPFFTLSPAATSTVPTSTATGAKYVFVSSLLTVPLVLRFCSTSSGAEDQ